ncbi:hypothetical protein [uncultured Desulfobulbus sp.]|uniref:hypothetical protein n=1 Tax=uncultured Desulfobulbus sp. TaxID=239745 RepID=UPI00374CF945
MEFEDQLHALIYFHLQEHTSGRHLLQSLEEDAFARDHIAPKKGIARSSFFEAMNERGFEQFLLVFETLQQQGFEAPLLVFINCVVFMCAWHDAL